MHEIRAEITANVWQVRVEEGQLIAEGDEVVAGLAVSRHAFRECRQHTVAEPRGRIQLLAQGGRQVEILIEKLRDQAREA